ncbi:MAG: hypothetical protein P4M09_07630 [Devosia sp.]|nr:hypothetical protein [Devosia sp.]
MRAVSVASLVVVALACPATAAAPKQPVMTTLDACSLKGRGFAIADGNACLKITGGVTYWQSWGNAVGGQGTGEGETIVVTPAGNSTVPVPRP